MYSISKTYIVHTISDHEMSLYDIRLLQKYDNPSNKTISVVWQRSFSKKSSLHSRI